MLSTNLLDMVENPYLEDSNWRHLNGLMKLIFYEASEF